MISPVIQEEATGCGIASVANIVGKTYPEMKAIANGLGIYADDTALWSDTQYVRTLLKNEGIATSDNEIPFTTWDNLPDTALLAIKHHQEDGKDFWHWVVFKRIDGNAMVIDSAAYLDSNTRTDFGEMTPKWFIKVSLLHESSFDA
ncbi:hypothetical protein MGA5115_00988 [Marinomonas gallaica]|uniref:Peptidase C39 domain-containing protein n=1 Tax=Marinomonas gallaica TaxID=1806667 RepID=A0A1C3JP31_9GAMM|nr:hypothetical protein [Marinomonas gallaica]SBT16902.1 hypothetical protein MGA5115_00988 [Marinomonas gallaica]SBT22147.1 hypothetical protein MGA5116_02760 [Marinomonas gallaica]